MYYREDCRGGSDHYPQVLEVKRRDGQGLAQPVRRPAGWNWKKLDKKRVAAESKLFYKVMGITAGDPDRLWARIRTVEGLSEAKDPKEMWALERWARLQSFLPPEPPRLPALQDSQGQAVVTDHGQKAKALARRFFLNPSANLTDIEDQAFLGDWEPGLDIQRKVTSAEVIEAIGKASP